MTKTVAPLSAAEVSKVKRIALYAPEDVDEALMKKVDERVEYIWREMARMAGVDLKWWDYLDECFNCRFDTIRVECDYAPNKNPTELEEAMEWLFTDYEIKLNYLSMPNDEWKADFKREAEILLAAEKKRKEKKRAKEAAKKKTERELLQQAFEELKKIKSPEDIKSMSIKKRIALARFIGED